MGEHFSSNRASAKLLLKRVLFLLLRTYLHILVQSKICERLRGFGCAIRRSPEFPFLSENWFWFNKRFAWHPGRPFTAVLEKQGQYIWDNWSSKIHQTLSKKANHIVIFHISYLMFEAKSIYVRSIKILITMIPIHVKSWQLALMPYNLKRGLEIIWGFLKLRFEQFCTNLHRVNFSFGFSGFRE